MNYQFPIITHINDVLPAIHGSEEFIVAVKDGYTVINYVVASNNTFPTVNSAGGSKKDRETRQLHAALRRECRGMIFCNETGRLLRRPYHKFFNVGEREETLPQKINLSNPHVILEKLDGSMIVPFILNGEVRWGTKMGLTDVAAPVEEFVKNSQIEYENYARDLLETGFVPIFEWCSRKQRIVLDYGSEDQLILTAVREQASGKYMPLNYYNRGLYNIPEVRTFEPAKDMNEFLAYVAGLKDVEGFVIRFADGHMAKVKCDWYVQIHRAKEAILHDRNIVEMIIDNNLDDVKAHLPAEDVERLTIFENEVCERLTAISRNIYKFVSDLQWNKVDRKNFALNMADRYDPLTRAAVFKLFDETEHSKFYAHVLQTVKTKTSKTASYEELKNYWLGPIQYN